MTIWAVCGQAEQYSLSTEFIRPCMAQISGGSEWRPPRNDECRGLARLTETATRHTSRSEPGSDYGFIAHLNEFLDKNS